MSWNPFRRSDVPRQSVISKAEEREVDKELKNLDRLEQYSKNLLKSTRRYMDGSTKLTKTELKLAQELSQSHLCQIDSGMRKVAEEWLQELNHLDTLTQQKNVSYQNSILGPVKKFSISFPVMKVAIKKRDQNLLEYSRCQAKVEKYQDRERTGQNIVKLEQSRKALRDAKKNFESQNQIVKDDLPKFIGGRKQMFDPCLQSLIQNQRIYFNEAGNIYKEITTKMTAEKDLLLDDDHDKQIEKKLQQIRALTIVVDD